MALISNISLNAKDIIHSQNHFQFNLKLKFTGLENNIFKICKKDIGEKCYLLFIQLLLGVEKIITVLIIMDSKNLNLHKSIYKYIDDLVFVHCFEINVLNLSSCKRLKTFSIT